MKNLFFAALLFVLAACGSSADGRDPEPIGTGPRTADVGADAHTFNHGTGERGFYETNQTFTESGGEGGLRRGSWNGRVFSNEYTGLVFTLPRGWVAATDAEIAERFGLRAEQMPAEGGFWELAEQQIAHDLMASSPFTYANVQITFERLPLGTGAYEYILAAEQTLTFFGATDFNSDFAPVRIGSYYWYRFQATWELSDIIHFVQFNTTFINVHGNFARVITITNSEVSETLEEIMAAFS